MSIDSRIQEWDVFEGKVVTVTGYGAFVEIEDGIEGFVSNGDLAWTKKTVDVKKYLAKGDVRDFRVLYVDKENKKLNLGIKQLEENPWDNIENIYPIGGVYKRKIKKLVKFGFFVELEDGIDALVHVSDISWDRNVDLSKFSVGQEVESVILDINYDEMKIACGMKQLTKSPWEVISEKYPPRTVVNGTISGMTTFGIFVKLEDDIEGLVHISEVSKNRVEDVNDLYSVGDSVQVVVLGVDIDKQRLSLSIKHVEMMMEKEELDKILQQNNPKSVTLGDMVNIDFKDN